MDDRLKKFVCVVDKGSFTRAAADLHISQPALTTTIKNLERDMEAQLLIRNAKRITMTAAGQQVYTAAKDLGDRMHNLQLKLSEIAQTAPVLNIGMIDSIAEAVFVHNDGFNKVGSSKISLVVDNSARLITELERGTIDAAFVTSPQTKQTEALATQSIGKEPLIIVTRADRINVIQQQLKKGVLLDFISYNKSSTTDNLLRNELSERGIELFTMFYSTSPEVILRLVLTHGGVAVLPYMMVIDFLRRQQLTPVIIGKSCVVNREICMIHRKSRQLPPSAHTMLQHTIHVIEKIQNASTHLPR